GRNQARAPCSGQWGREKPGFCRKRPCFRRMPAGSEEVRQASWLHRLLSIGRFDADNKKLLPAPFRSAKRVWAARPAWASPGPEAGRRVATSRGWVERAPQARWVSLAAPPARASADRGG